MSKVVTLDQHVDSRMGSARIKGNPLNSGRPLPQPPYKGILPRVRFLAEALLKKKINMHC
jgi:hypothetical protein